MVIKNNLEEMNIGDIIVCRYKTGGYFSELGTCVASELPLAGSANPDGSFYFRKVDTGLLIADRVVQHSISWDTLNILGLIQGKPHISFPYTPSQCHPTYPSLNTCDKNDTTQMFFYAIYSGNLDQFTSEQRSISFNLGKVVTYFDMRLKVQFELSSFDLLTSMDGIVWANAGSYTITAMTSQTYNIVATCKFIKIHNMRNIANGANLGLSEISVAGVDSLIVHDYLIRSLSGGNSYLDENGKSSLIDKGLGAFPPNNEWDKYIVKSTLNGTIVAGDDNVWNYRDVYSWTQETPINGQFVPLDSGSQPTVSSFRMKRGYTNPHPWANLSFESSSYSSGTTGFRPVLEYLEPKSKATTLFY